MDILFSWNSNYYNDINFPEFVARFDTIAIKALLEQFCLGMEMDKGFGKFTCKCKDQRSGKKRNKDRKHD